MKASRRHECEQDFELNIAPIIDCFVVLIAYLLISASFISLTSMDVQVAVPAVGASAPADPSVEVTLDLDAHRNLTVKVSGTAAESTVIPARASDWDFDAIRARLESVRGRFPAASSAILTAAQEVEYSQVVRVVEATRAIYPQLALGERDE